MTSDEKYEYYENALLGILHDQGELLPFLDTIFKFLYNRTDFFKIQKTPSDTIGFPRGKFVLTAMRKYEKLALDEHLKQNPCRDTKRGEPEGVEFPQTKADKTNTIKVDEDSAKNEPSVEEKENTATDDAREDGSEEEEEKDENAKHLKQQQRVFQSQSHSYNGAIRDNYSWSQSIMDVDVMVHVPENITKGNQVVVDMKHTHLDVKMKDGKELKQLVDGDLCWKINVENSCWTLIPGEAVHLNLEKMQERWWDCLLTDEPKINIRNIDACRPLSDLGEDEQVKIEQLMFNEHQKRLGKPTVEQLKMEKALKDAWNTEGSPFKGQPFDMSNINIATSGSTAFVQQ